MVEPHHALRDVERTLIGERHDTGAETNALGVLTDGGQEHLR
jgi:hypothetical protein